MTTVDDAPQLHNPPDVGGAALASSEAEVSVAGSYVPQDFEAAWQQRWEEEGLYRTREDPDKPKFYALDFFPYPSGDGLSVGHCRNYIPTDTYSRFMRMRGYTVLHPMGWDAFGEPTENKAIEVRESPRALTDRYTANYKRQMRLVGISFDWDREIDSSLPDYYRWTQWFFLLLHKRGLAYRNTNWQWWCPVCQTTMSNQEVQTGEDGELFCWRDHPGVTKKQIPAWFFKITAYADQLLADLSEIDWPSRIKLMQENWIGRSTGTDIVFTVDAPTADGGTERVEMPVFTTRPDTVFGVTFMVLAPEHGLVQRLTTPERRAAVEAYVEQAKRQSEIERTATEREKSGIFTGAYATNPLNGEQVPIWVADYVLATYGTGMVMGVPAHDQRDFEFAQEFGLDIKVVIAPPGWDGQPLTKAYVGPGEMVNSGSFDGTFTRANWPKLPPAERAELAEEWGFTVEALDRRLANQEQDGIESISDAVEARGWGQRAVNYRMRDWLISRQRYWGGPIPIIHCPSCGEVPVPEDELPVLLPKLDDIAPGGDGRSPLVRATDWVNVDCPQCGGAARRETDTMGGFACSSWYQLRFTGPDYHEGPFDPTRARFWMPVDLYVGGAEHAVMHLLYARFWYKVMRDANLGVPGNEPFHKLLNQGQVHAPDGRRMSKSRGNVITPDEMVERYGADSLRLYELFMAPFEQDVDWSEQGINGQRRFLGRIWDMILQTVTPAANGDGTAVARRPADPELARQLHKTIRRVTEDIEAFKFNTMVAALMEFANELGERYRAGTWQTRTWDEAIRTLLVLLAPAAPHVTAELWQRIGQPGSVHEQPWPAWDEALVRDELVTVVVQVDGKVRERLELPATAAEEDVRAAARESERVQRWVSDWEAVQWRYIPGRIVSLNTKARR